MKRYKLAESENDGFTTEYFIDLPDQRGRLAVRLPNYLTQTQHSEFVKVILKALND